VVRKTIGYFWFEGDEALAALEKVYSFLNPLINYFYPTKKCIGKKTLPNGKVKRIYEKRLKTPCERVLEHPDVSDEDKTNVKKIRAKLDIVNLQEGLEKACDELECIASKKYAAPSLGRPNG
jgi:DNA-binding Xre family transcriptional regulator